MREFLQPLLLLGTVQQYDWGKTGSDSLVALLAGRNSESGTFAEYWFGAHPKSSSKLIIDRAPVGLREAIASNPEVILGKRVVEAWGKELPFLFKILSVARPLSIQVHPDLRLAEELHKKDPANYPDSNHKPEIGVAATKVQMLCGFRSNPDFKKKVLGCPQIVEALSEKTLSDLEDISEESGAAVKEQVYRSVMNLSAEQVEELCGQLYTRTEKIDDPEIERWLEIVSDLYPKGDVGVFSFFMLNIVTLQPGEAVFSLPGVPHAYLSGDIVECMANCDNTIRAGLTSKFKDTDVLLDMVDYRVDQPCLVETEVEGMETRYLTPAKEFYLTKIESKIPLPVGGQVQGPAIAFCLDGAAYATVEEEGEGRVSIESGQALFFSAALNELKPLELGLEGTIYLTTINPVFWE